MTCARHVYAAPTASTSSTKLATQARRRLVEDCCLADCATRRSIADWRGVAAILVAEELGTGSVGSAGGGSGAASSGGTEVEAASSAGSVATSSAGEAANSSGGVPKTATGAHSLLQRAHRTTRPAVTRESGTS